MLEKSLATDEDILEQGSPNGVSAVEVEPIVSPIPDAEPLDDPLNILPHVRSRYFRENVYPYGELMRRKEYEAEKRTLQIELMKLQNSMRETGDRAIILFEGAGRRRQGRDNQAIHGALEPSHGARGGAGQAIRGRTGPVVFPAIHQATSRLPERSCCSTARGTTVRAWSE